MNAVVKELLDAFVREVQEHGYAHEQAYDIAKYCDKHKPCDDLLQEISAYLKIELTPYYRQEGWGTGISVKEYIEDNMLEIKHDMESLEYRGISIF